MRIESWLARAAAATPRRTAVAAAEGKWTYEQLHAVARDGGAWLASRGVGPGARVAITLPAGLAFAQALHACLLVGAVAVPVDLRLGPRERARILSGVDLEVDEPLWNGPGGAAAPAAEAHDLRAPAVIIHTSGTTGVPQPVTLTYSNLLWSALGSAVALGLDPQERWLGALPVSHVGGLSIIVRSAIYGTTAVLHERFDPEASLAALRHEQITVVSLVPTTLARLLDAGLRDPPALRCALVGGGPVPPALLERARAAGVPVSQTYGMTEACSQITTASPEGPGDDAGPPLFCTRVTLGRDGEILVAGPTVAAGAVGADGWLHTGDLGSLDAAGRLAVTGRLADTVVTGGENVAPAEVEAVLMDHPAVSEAAVHGRPDPEWGEALVASVVLAVPVDPETLRLHCAARLASFKVPKEIRLVGALPRTASGKLLRRAL